MTLNEETVAVLRARALSDGLRNSTHAAERHLSDYISKLLNIAAQTGHLDVEYLKQITKRYDLEDADEA